MEDSQAGVPHGGLQEQPEVSIVIPTFRRPELLRRAIESCRDQRTASGRPYEIVAVDNAPEGSAASVVAEARREAKVSIRYVHEPQPGISHARNAGVASASGQLLALIDDDERASPAWLWHLTRTQQAYAADVVFGPVFPKFERPPGRHAEFFERFHTYTVRRSTGARVGERSTNNALVRRACILADGPFDTRLALTGGEDTLFFAQLRAGGSRFAWCAEARVTEAIPPERTTWRYVWRRSFRRGQCRAATPMLLEPPMPLRTASWMGVGAVQLLGFGVAAGVLWLLRAPASPYYVAKAVGGMGKILWMERFQKPSYGGGSLASTAGGKRRSGAGRSVARIAKRALTPSFFYISRRLYVLLRYYLGYIYDDDLLFVKDLGPAPLLVDVGANAGQSALSMGLLSPSARIISFEANAENINDLRRVRRVLGCRYEFHHTALSDRTGRGWLKMPVAGNAPVPGESSLEDDAFDDEELNQRIGNIRRIERQPVSLSTLDSHGLAADFIKIDVQGHELAVIKGSMETIRKYRPVLLIETNHKDLPAIRAVLERARYQLFMYRPDANTLRRCDRPTGLNFFALHDEHVQRFSSKVVSSYECPAAVVPKPSRDVEAARERPCRGPVARGAD